MNDFDDLIPKTRLNPTLDNPFEDPFADVVRPRSPDPWAIGASYYDQPTQPSYLSDTPAVDAFSYSATRDPYNEPDAFAAAAPVDISRPAAPVVPVEEPNVDPLDAAANASTSIDSDDKPLRRNPFGPLPVVKPEPIVREPPPAAAAAAAAPAPPVETVPENDTTPKSSVPVDAPIAPPASDLPPATESATESVPETVKEEAPAPKPSAPVPEPTKADSAPVPVVAEEPKAVIPDAPTPALPPTPVTPGPSIPPSSPAPSQTTPRYDPIVSPLQTPSQGRHAQLERSFNGLTLGGEAPGWGGPPSSSSSSSFAAPTSPTPQPGHLAAAFDPRAPGHSPSFETEPLAIDTTEPEKAPKSNKLPPLFTITVGDPQKIGDPISAHIVYTVSTQTSSPDFKKATFSVLRRYSDFLWLYDTLVANNPGVIVPPVPEKLSFGRFEDSFVESRRLGLNKCIQKIANHPKLSRDEDLKLFLESDSFALDIKHRKVEGAQDKGLMATIGSTIVGSKFYEIDEWFDKKRTYLDALESQLRGLVKAIEVVAKQRSEVIVAPAEFAEAISALANSDLSKQMSHSLSVLADTERKTRDLQEDQNRQDVITVLGTVEEYLRLISSVRVAFSSRVKTYQNMKAIEAEASRVRTTNERTLRSRAFDRQAMLPLQREIEIAETKAQDARSEFENVTRLVKMEMGRFEDERVSDFKSSLEAFLEGMISQQSEEIEAWEQYQQLLLKRVNTNPNAPVTV